MPLIPRHLSRSALGAAATLITLAAFAQAAWASPDAAEAHDAASAVASVVPAAPNTPTTDPDTPTVSPNAVLIVIDPGHGGPFSNANANGLREKNVNLQVARALRTALVRRGYRVVMTRDADTALSLTNIATWNYSSSTGLWSWARDGRVNGNPPNDDLQARVNLANGLGADLFISVHANGAKSRSVRGHETFASPRDSLGISLSRQVQRSVLASTGFVNRGARTADFYVLRWSNMPAILLETGFISNPADAALLKQPAFRTSIAEGVATGVDEWLATQPYHGIYPRVTGTDTSSYLSALASAGYPEGARVAVLADAEAWFDVAGAASLAASLGGPLLWMQGGSLDATLSATLSSLSPERVVVVGRTGSAGSKAVSRIAAAAEVKPTAVRTVGASSAAALSASIAESVGVGPSGHVFVGAVEDTRTLLAAAAIAATRRAPLLVAQNGALSASANDFLTTNRAAITRVVLVGSAARVPASLAQGAPYRRYEKTNFTALSAALNAAYHAERRTNKMRPVVADPRSAPEYLAASARAASPATPVLPAYGAVLPVSTRLWITNRRAAIGGFEVHDPDGRTPLNLDHALRKADYL